MALLDRADEDVVIYYAESYLDDDHNIMYRLSGVGIPAKAEVQPARQSGTSARRAEQDNEGYESEEVYRLRFTRKWDSENPVLTPQSEIEWLGERWTVVGKPTFYRGSRRTKHTDYQIRRT
jgi:hypothetical protein